MQGKSDIDRTFKTNHLFVWIVDFSYQHDQSSEGD